MHMLEKQMAQIQGVILIGLPGEEHWRFAVATAIGMCLDACVHMCVHGCIHVHVNVYVCACVNTKELIILSLITLLYIVSEWWILMTVRVKEMVQS